MTHANTHSVPAHCCCTSQKPENIGFDVKGVVKVFDFGLAKELHPEDKLANDTYKMTGNTGSIRYMAPEVANKHTCELLVLSSSCLMDAMQFLF